MAVRSTDVAVGEGCAGTLVDVGASWAASLRTITASTDPSVVDDVVTKASFNVCGPAESCPG